MRKHLFFFILILSLLPGVFSLAKASSSSDIRYLFAYFTDKNENRNGMHLAWSADGYTWTPIGPEHSFLKCDYGTWYADKRMRDPFVMKGPDGLWHCIWTLNWDGNAIGYAHSEDLVHWSRQSYPKVMEGYEVRNCWAPEMIYDDENRQYVIFWASTIKENGVWKTEPGEKYDLSFFTRIQEGGQSGALQIQLRNRSGKPIAQTAVRIASEEWEKQCLTLQATEDADSACLSIQAVAPAVYALDMILKYE